jgi:AhpD family alkylhydroperoxidase
MTITSDKTGQVSIPVRFDFDSLAPTTAKAVNTLHAAAIADARAAGLEQGVIELIRLRASQLNGCAYCVDMHGEDARTAGVTAQRVDLLPVWRDAPFYTREERAALDLVEAVVHLPETHAPASVVDAALAALGEAKTAAVLAVTMSITAWNQIGVTSRCWPVAPRED